jgi:hypothetical protein
MARYRDPAGSSMALLMALFKTLKRSFNPNLFRFEKGRSAHGRAYNTAVRPKFLADLVNELRNFRFR